MRYFLYCRKSTEDEERQVLSLQSQREALDRTYGSATDIDIVEVFEESKSAKTPGRPVFALMLSRIELGEADGIMTWAPDRLARNSVDGGQIIYLLDTGSLRDLKFATYTFENNSQGKFMLSIMFGQSKYYSDALSENVRRGNRTKLENGWRPNRAPLGYVNDPVTRTILPHPQHFALVRRMFELFLSGSHSPREIALTARDEWGFRTPTRKRSGGKPIALSTIYKMLGNAFYAGLIPWKDELYVGAHTPIVTKDEFAQAQALLKRAGQRRPRQQAFPFTGLIRCGNCGMRITAETKTKKSGRSYTYYRCTRRGLAARCREPAVSAQWMTRAIAAFLSSLTVVPEVERWVAQQLRDQAADDEVVRQKASESRAAAVAEVAAQLRELTSLRLRRFMSDDEFVAERSRLLAEKATLEEHVHSQSGVDRFELFGNLVSFSKYAVEWLLAADLETQRFIARTTGSNYVLTAKKLSVEAVKPFHVGAKSAEFLQLCTVVEDVRTSKAINDRKNQQTSMTEINRVAQQGDQLLRHINASLDLPETQRLLHDLKLIHKMVGVQPAEHSRTSDDRAPRAEKRLPAPHRDQASRHKLRRRYG